jgi:hypothetical protein
MEVIIPGLSKMSEPGNNPNLHDVLYAAVSKA